MNKREIQPSERPVCQICNTPLDWYRNTTYYEEIFGWEFNCNCVDTDRLKEDSTFNFTP